jgi:hypothetical protein
MPEATLLMMVERVEAETGERFLPSLVRYLADALGVQYVFVSEMSEDRTRYRTLAFVRKIVLIPSTTDG